MVKHADPKPQQPEPTRQRPEPIKVMSFFTGGGFLDIGFEQAGFEIAWSNEYNENLADLHDHAYTAWRRAANPAAPEAKIKNRKSVTSLVAEDIRSEAFGDNAPARFGVIGGPPCTDFSQGGLNAGSGGKSGKLTGVYVSKLLQLKPAFFVLENVPGLLSHPRHLAYFERKKNELKSEYWLHQNILRAMDYGVPQDRERLFVIGIRKDLDPENRKFVWPKADAKFFEAHKKTWPKENRFGAKVTKPADLPDELMVHTALGGENGVEHLPNGGEWFTPYSKKFKEVPEGKVSTKSFKRLHRFRYSPTAWYGNNEVHLHPTEPRRLSVREALRLQTVPDEYAMPEDFQLSAKFKLICNGVPVKLANRLAVAVREHVEALPTEPRII